MSSLKIALCQMKVVEDKDKNLLKAEEMIRESVKNNTNIVVLPEMFNCPYSNNFFPAYAEEYPGKTTLLLSGLAKELNIYIIGGSIPEAENGYIYNTCYIFDKNGNIIGKHRKMHLFDVEIENGIVFKESDTLKSGNSITVVDTEYGKIGVAICYDIRFPEIMRLMALQGAKIIVVPAAFNMTTGPAHWHSLGKIRALDNQVFFIAASPARNIESCYTAYGHSLIVNPWGQIIYEAQEYEAILYGEIDLEKVNTVRKELPLLKHRRLDVYDIKLVK